ncbi:MAG: hypothetical protein M3Y76_08955 [Chloroflexota bacterium]|nr:hypothetical protein [Chloroflexota bacterium]
MTSPLICRGGSGVVDGWGPSWSPGVLFTPENLSLYNANLPSQLAPTEAEISVTAMAKTLPRRSSQRRFTQVKWRSCIVGLTLAVNLRLPWLSPHPETGFLSLLLVPMGGTIS